MSVYYPDSIRAGRSGVRTPVGGEIFPWPIQTGPDAHTASRIMGTGSKAAGAWRWPSSPFQRWDPLWVNLYLCLLSVPAWKVTGQLYLYFSIQRSPISDKALLFGRFSNFFSLCFWRGHHVDKDEYGALVHDTGLGKNQSTRRKTCPSVTLFNTDLTRTVLESNTGLRGQRPAGRTQHQEHS
jgi:hypothetical protein